jgi:hypothetical protein
VLAATACKTGHRFWWLDAQVAHGIPSAIPWVNIDNDGSVPKQFTDVGIRPALSPPVVNRLLSKLGSALPFDEGPLAWVRTLDPVLETTL